MNISWQWLLLNIVMPLVISLIASYIYSASQGTIQNTKVFTSKFFLNRRIKKIMMYEDIIKSGMVEMYYTRLSTRHLAFLLLGYASASMGMLLVFANKYDLLGKDDFFAKYGSAVAMIQVSVLFAISLEQMFAATSIFFYKSDKNEYIEKVLRSPHLSEIPIATIRELERLLKIKPPQP